MTILRNALLASLVLVGCDGNGALPPDREPYAGVEEVPLDCIPNLDGVIEADELPLVLDTEISYLVSPPGQLRTVDVQGEVEGATRVWDWSVDLADDQLARIEAFSIQDRWYANRFRPTRSSPPSTTAAPRPSLAATTTGCTSSA